MLRFLTLIVLLVTAAQWWAAGAFERRVLNKTSRLLADPPPENREALQIPAAIRAFAERCGASDETAPAAIRIAQRCRIRGAPGEAWRPLTAEQVIGVRTSGFVWWARQSLGPMPIAKVVDALESGRGLLEARLFGSIPLIRATGPEIDQGEFMRYLAELPLAPDAMLHNPRLAWRQLSDEVFEVSDESASGTSAVRLVFEQGELARCEADSRPRLVGKESVPTAWAGRFGDYREFGGRRVPTRVEVSWILDSGPFVYFEGEITDLELLP